MKTQMGLDFSLVADALDLVAGVDEVGRGPLCGAVVTAAVILDPNRPILGLNDSKKLTEARREKLYDEICEKALSWHIARAEVEEIDELRRVLETHERDAAFQAGVGYYQQEGDFDFHYRIIQGSGNRTLTQMLCGELYQLVRMYRMKFSTTPNRPHQAFAEHHRILDAIADRDGELAELLMRRHIGASKRNIARHYQDGANQTATERGES